MKSQMKYINNYSYIVQRFINGWSGIGNRLEELFVNPLSRALFGEDVKTNSYYTVEEIFLDENNIWKLRGRLS